MMQATRKSIITFSYSMKDQKIIIIYNRNIIIKLVYNLFKIILEKMQFNLQGKLLNMLVLKI